MLVLVLVAVAVCGMLRFIFFYDACIPGSECCDARRGCPGFGYSICYSIPIGQATLFDVQTIFPY